MTNRLLLLMLFFFTIVATKEVTSQSFFAPSDTLNKKRFFYTSGITAATFTGSTIGLYQTWYKNYDQSSFHTFNDWGEWQNVDKFGHLYTNYFQAHLGYKLSKWTGLNENQSIWVGVGGSLLFQTTVEVLDGFSDKWGFSIGDYGFNLIGAGLFASQQKIWKEQRILVKMSSFSKNYKTDPIFSQDQSLQTTELIRSKELFGSHTAERFLKDYNAQTIWFSINVESFLHTKWPTWLNIAVGYSGENMFGGFDNSWTEEGVSFNYNGPRLKQFLLSPDIDFSRIKTNSPFLKSVFHLLNIFKIPMPTLQYSNNKRLNFHFIYLN